MTPLSSRVVDFLHGHITSLLQLEALLLVVQSRGTPRTAQEISAEMYVPSEAVGMWLKEFADSGFCAPGERGYSAPESEHTSALLAEVEDAYLRRPVSVGRVIFGSTRDDLASLSEAFRLRKER